MGKFSEYKLPLKSMPIGTQTFEYKIGKQLFVNMEYDAVRDADVDTKLIVTHKDDYYDLLFRFNGTLTVACDRCLDDLELPVDTTYHIIVKYGEDYNDDSDDFLIIPESDNYLNVAYMIYDSLALAIPLRHVHPAGKCNRAMTNLLKKHRVESADPEEAEIEEGVIDEMSAIETEESAGYTDSRWDKLRDFRPEE